MLQCSFVIDWWHDWLQYLPRVGPGQPLSPFSPLSIHFLIFCSLFSFFLFFLLSFALPITSLPSLGERITLQSPPLPFVSDIAVFVLKRDVKLQQPIAVFTSSCGSNCVACWHWWSCCINFTSLLSNSMLKVMAFSAFYASCGVSVSE